MKTRAKKQSQEPVVQINNENIFIIDTIFKKYSKWITVGLVSIMLFINFHEFIFGRLYYLFSDIAIDTIIYGYPLLYHASYYIHSEGFPLWSFAQGMGQNIMSSTLCDPFYWIVYLSGTAHVAYAIIWMEITKIVLAALIFYHFLKLWNLSYITTMVGTLLYCFSGFMIVGGEWWVFSTEACYLAVLLLGFEKLYRQNTGYIFTLAITLFAIHNPFELYTSSIFLIIYFLFRHFLSEDPSFKKFYSISLRMAGFGLLGIVISSFIFVANFQKLLESPRGSGNFSYFKTLFSVPVFSFEKQEHYVTAILRFFSSDLMGNGLNYTGWHNYLEAPLFYIGLLPLLLMPQVFLSSSNRKKIVHAVFLIVILIPVIFPFFRYALFLFAGDYYRSFSIFVSLSFLFLGLYALDGIDREYSINIYALLGTLFILILILYFPYPTKITNINIADGSIYQFSQNKTGIVSINTGLRSVISIFLVLYTGLILLFKYRSCRPYLRILLLLIISIEIGYMCAENFKNRYALSPDSMSDYVANSKDAVDYMNATDKGFFRVNKNSMLITDYMALYNSAKVEGYNGTSSYDPFNQKYYIRFLEEMGIIEKGNEPQSRFSSGLVQQPLLWSFASIKYHIGPNTDYSSMKLIEYEPLKKFGNIILYKNNHFLPLGYTYDQFISLNEFRQLSQFQKELIIQKAIVVEEPIDDTIKRKLKEYDLKDITQNNSLGSYLNDIEILKKDSFKITHFSQNNISGTIQLDTPKVLFFTIPYDKGWRVFIDDNKEIKPLLCNIGFMGFFLEPGKHSIELYYRPPYFVVSLIASLVGLSIYIGLIVSHIIKKKINR